jgi:hypothetical protein
MELGIEMKQLIEHGEIEQNPAFALWKQARQDDAVQQLIADAKQLRRYD